MSCYIYSSCACVRAETHTLKCLFSCFNLILNIILLPQIKYLPLFNGLRFEHLIVIKKLAEIAQSTPYITKIISFLRLKMKNEGKCVPTKLFPELSVDNTIILEYLRGQFTGRSVLTMLSYNQLVEKNKIKTIIFGKEFMRQKQSIKPARQTAHSL